MFPLPFGARNLDVEAIKKKIETIEPISQDAHSVFNTIGEVFFKALTSSIIKTLQSKITETMREGRRRRLSDKSLWEEIGKHMMHGMDKEIERRSGEIEKMSHSTEVQRLTPDEIYRTMALSDNLKAFVEKYELFEGIYGLLAESAPNQDPDAMSEALRNLAANEIIYGSVVNSVCVNPLCSYSSIQYSLIPTVENCPVCGGPLLMFHSFDFEDDIKACWELGLLQKLIVGYILDDQDWVKKVWVHKAVTQEKPDGNSESLWIDVICQTKEDKLILVYVTTQSDLSNISSNLNKRWHGTLEKSRFDFDGVFCISCARPLENYINPVGSIWLFGASHLDKIYSHMEYVYHNEILKSA
jgi:hypothetical protein